MNTSKDTEKKLDDEILNIVYTFIKHYEERENELVSENLERREEELYE